VIEQTQSPVRIAEADLNGIRQIVAGQGSTGSFGARVENISDAPVSKIGVSFLLATTGSSAKLTSQLEGPIDPGHTAWVRGIGAATLDTNESPRIYIGVESLRVAECLHVPTPPVSPR
jgi:hypothetical protein